MKKMYSILLTLCFSLFCGLQMQAQQQQPFTLKATSAHASTGETVCIGVEVHGGYELLALQYSMHYDPAVLKFESLQNFTLPNLDDFSFGLPSEDGAIPEGIINVSWFEQNDMLQATFGGQTLYEVCFEVIGAAGDFSEITFENEPTPFEIISANDVLLPVSHIGGQVLVDSGFALSIDTSDVTSIDCLDANLGAIDISVSGGTMPYEYVWTDGTDMLFVTEDLEGLAPGIYSVTVTDAANTTVTATFRIGSTNQNLLLSATVTDATCNLNNGSIGLSPINDFSIVFNWDFGATTEYVQNLAAGTYHVTLTDTETGCQQVETFNIESSELIVGIGYECQLPDNAEVSVAVWDGGTLPYTVTLDDESIVLETENDIATFSVAPEGTYTFNITDANGCSTTATATLDCEVASEIIVGTSYECNLPATANLSAIVWSGGLAPYVFSIDGGITFMTADNAGEVVTFSVAPNATYELLIIDALGNTTSSSIFVDCEDTPDYAGNLFISSPQLTVDPGATFCIPVLVDSFIDVNSLQFAMSWDTDIISFTGVDNYHPSLDLNDSNFGLTNEPLDDGLLRFSWMDSEVSGVDLANGSALFEVCFSAVGNPGSSSIFNYTDSVIPIEASNSNLEFLQVFRSSGMVTLSGTPENSVTFIASEEVTFPDGEVCVDISVEDFSDILSMQFSMTWDTDVLSYTSIEIPETGLTDFNESVFGTANANQGMLALSWFESGAIDGITLADGTVIFQVCFEASGDDGESSAIQFTNSPTPIEVLNDNDQPLTFIGQDGLVTIDIDGFVVPGDTDHNLEANHYDLLNIGLGFGQMGTMRADASLEFMPQHSEDWGVATPSSGLDYKHADADGNGVVNADDTLGIILNWGESLNFMENTPTNGIDQLAGAREQMSPFFVLPDTVNAGEMASFPIILGTPVFPADDVYGLAFTLLYDTEVIVEESVHADFDESWLGILNDNMISVQKDFYNTGQIDIAITRTDGQAMNGAGQIGRINVIIEDVIFRSSEDYELIFNITNVRAISPSEEPQIFLPTETTSIINSDPVSTNNPELEQLITLVPNPANDYVNIQTKDVQVEQIDLYNINGQLLKTYPATNRIITTDLAAGTYLVKMITNSGVVSQRIVIQR